MARRATLRASDADREHVAERLRHAAGEGRIASEELEERLETAFSARTYGELDAVVVDLPGTPVRRRERQRALALPRSPALIVALVFLLPVVVSMLIAAVVVITTLFTAWALVLALGWWVFGQHRRYPPGRLPPGRRSVHAYSRWPAGRPGGPRPRPWV
jgi:Flp pilus assembly protein TadB